MSPASPLDVARGFCAGFGPTYEDAVATCGKLLHTDVSRRSVTSDDRPVEGLAAVQDDLRRAREIMGAEGFGIDVHRIRADGDLVLMRRTDTVLDAEGDLLHTLDVMSMLRVVDGKIVWSRECFFDSRTFDEAWGA